MPSEPGTRLSGQQTLCVTNRETMKSEPFNEQILTYVSPARMFSNVIRVRWRRSSRTCTNDCIEGLAVMQPHAHRDSSVEWQVALSAFLYKEVMNEKTEDRESSMLLRRKSIEDSRAATCARRAENAAATSKSKIRIEFITRKLFCYHFSEESWWLKDSRETKRSSRQHRFFLRESDELMSRLNKL